MNPRTSLHCASLALALVACEPAPSPAPADADVARDVVDDAPEASLDGATDARVDARPDAVDAAPDAGPRCPSFAEAPAEMTGGLCDAVNVTDLSTLVGDGRTWVGWVNAPVRAASATLDNGCAYQGGMPATRERVFRYRMRRRAHLRVTTDLPGSYCGPEGLADTFVGVFSACDVNARSYGCGTQLFTVGAGAATVVTNQSFDAGTEVFIGVGVLARGSARPPVASVELGVEEVAAPRAGSTCIPGSGDSDCPPGHTCVESSPTEHRGVCEPHGRLGAECRPGPSVTFPEPDPRCDDGLRCAPFDHANGTCYRRRAPGERCDRHFDACSRAPVWNCRLDSPAEPNAGRCVMDGAEAGGACSFTDRSCPAGLTCSGQSNSDTCRAAVALGAPCDPVALRDACPDGATCAREADGTRFACRADGAAPGAACRDAAPRCDGALRCSSETGPGRCAAVVGAGAACDPRWGSTRCPEGEHCLATSFSEGRCVRGAREADQENAHALFAQGLALPFAVRGAITPARDVDCYAFDVPAGAGLRLEVSNGAGWCAPDADPVLTVHDARGALLDVNDDAWRMHACSVLDSGHVFSSLKRLPAGRYVACVRSFRGEAPIGEYVLGVRSVPAP